MFQFPRLTPFVRQFLIAIFSVFVLQLALRAAGVFDWAASFALRPGSVSIHTLYQVITYPSVHMSVISTLISMLFFWWIVAPFEERYGSHRTKQLTALSLIGCGVISVLIFGFQNIITSSAPLIGISPVTWAAMSAYAYSLPSQAQINLFGAFAMKPMHILYLMLGISVLFFLESMDGVNLVKDISAMFIGIMFIRHMKRPTKKKITRKSQATPFRVIQGQKTKSNEDKTWLN